MSFQKFYNFNNYKSKITDDLISVIQTIKSSERKVLVCLPDKRWDQKLARYSVLSGWCLTSLSSVLDHLGEMLYPLLSVATSFPLGSPSESMDSLLRNGSIRVRRAMSEVEPSLLRPRADTAQMAGTAGQWTQSFRSGDITAISWMI